MWEGKNNAHKPSVELQQTSRDGELAAEVHRMLVDDLGVPDSSIESSVSSGVVLLMGTASCAFEREEAERAARSVPGVVSVRNEIAIWPSDVESELIRELTRELIEERRSSQASAVAENDGSEEKTQ